MIRAPAQGTAGVAGPSVSIEGITSPGDIDFVSSDGSVSIVGNDALDLIDFQAAPHAIGGPKHTADTLANLNAKVTDSKLVGHNSFERRKKVEPPQITSDQNDYAPAAGSMYLIDSNAPRNITGWATGAGVDASHILVVNDGSFAITFKHQSASSVAANRFANDTGTDIVLGPGERLSLLYDTTASRWRVTKGGAAGAGATTFDALTDTPSSKAGQASRLVRVNAGETALEYTPEFKSTSTGLEMQGDKEFVPLNDNEGSVGKTGKRFKLVKAVTVDAGDLIFRDPATGEELWRIVERHDALIAISARSGKKFRLLMEEEVELT